MTTEIES